MKYYIDIKLLGDDEVNLGFIWRKIYLELHLMLSDIKDKNSEVDIGFSFPNYQTQTFPLGDILRIFANSKEELVSLNLIKYLGRFDEYIIREDIKPVPKDTKTYVTFSRKQFKSNPERLARRQAKRKGISIEEALKNYAEMTPESTKLPFIMMKSSKGQYMKIFIEKSISDVETKGKYSTYGLSKVASVPWF
ncbi:MAG: type I-F CRISPR-associated endoribonuclease Cas6/Csy4 [Sulfurovum sp.]